MGLQPEFTPNALKSSFYSPEELAEISMANEAQRLEDRGVMGRGLIRGMYQTGSLLNNALGGLTEPFAPQYSQTAFNDALGYDQLAQRQIAPSDVLSYDKVDGLGSAARYIGGAFAENLPNALLTLPAGLLTGVALRGSALSPMARIVAGSMAGAAPLQFGEGIQTMRQDPNILATTTPTERLGYGAGYAALTAPMEGLGEGMLAARAAGAGSKALKNVFKDGLSATLKDSAAHVAKAVPESMLTEGAAEALQQATQQGLKTHLNPERDKSKDEHELIDSFLKGWAAGAPTSIVGRGADAAWAQGRGATDALKGLLRDKILPDHLKDRPDNELLDWDNADNEQRNSWASQLADSIMSGDAPQTLKDSAAKFYERMQSGAKDAWTSLSEPLMEDERVGRARAGVERFINAAKKANDNTFGKANAEASEFDQDLYQQFGEYLDPKGASARDTELKSNLFNTVKQALIDDDWADLPITELEDEFGTIGRATAAITKLRENMVRAGMVEHDDEFGKLLEATALDGQRGDRAKMDVIARYGRSYIKGKPKDAELKAVSRGLTDILSKWSSLSDTHKAAFEKQMKKEFGANAEKVIEAHKPKTIADTEVDLSEDSGNREVSPSKQRFIGQATQHSRKAASGGQQQNTIEDHGGFFRLDHPDKQTRDSIKRAFNDAQADLRKDGYFVKPMSPLEYHEATGISKSTIRRHLGYKTIAELETSNAKILAVEPRSEDALYYDKDDTSLDHDDIKALSERTTRSLSTIPESFPIEDKVLLGKISKALKQGKGSRAAMRELGFEHGVKLRPAGGKVYLHNNPRHGGNGIFTVHMKDGTKYDISAQHLISQMRERGKGTLTDRSAYRMFLSGIAAIQNNENVEKITANNLWGETDEHPFAMAPGVTNHFQLEKGLNLSWAHKRSQAYEKSLNQPTNLDAAVEELNDVNEQLAEDPENEELLERQAELEEAVAQLQAEQDQYEGEGERHEPGEVRTSDDMTGLEAQESGLGPRTNDELTGEVLHPYGKLMRTGDRENVAFNGVPLRLRSGVGAKNIVGTIRKVVAVAKQLSFTPDKAMDMVARAAAAQKDGNRKAFTVLSNLAAYEMGEAILERMADLQEQGKAEGRKEWVQLRDAWASEATLLKSYEEGKEYAQLIEQAKADLAEAKTTENKKAVEKAKNILDGLVDPITAYMPYDARKGIKVTKRHDFDNAADRASYRSEFIATIEYKSDAEIKAEMEAREQRIERYKGYTQTDNVQQLIKMMEQEQAASQRLLDKRASGERTQKTEAIKVKEDKSVYKGLSNKEDPFEKARKDLQGRKDSAQAAADDLSARAKADEALMALADEVEQVVEEEIKAAVGKVVGKHPKAQLTKNLRRLGNALVNAAKALYQSAKDGKLNKNELIAELRKALRAFKQVVGGAARELDKLVSELIAEYQAAKVQTRTEEKFTADIDEKFDAESVRIHNELGKTGFAATHDSPIRHAGVFNWRDHAGKGEGNAAFGMGTYLSTSDEVHSNYKEMFTAKINRADAITGQEVLEQLKVLRSGDMGAIAKYFDLDESEITKQDVREQIADLQKRVGATYQVTVKADQSEVLDWNAKLKDQPKKVQDAVVAAFDKNMSDTPMGRAGAYSRENLLDMTGEELYRALDSKMVKNITKYVEGESASDALQEAGVVGHKYAASGGLNDSHPNYVIYDDSRIETNFVQFNAEGSYASGKGVSQAEFDEAKDYIAKVLGPKVITQLVKDLGGNSAAWNRKGGDTIIRIAMHAANPMSKAHHEAMHEFFQRLLDSGSPAADILRTAANSKIVQRQIEQFFHKDANYAKIKQAIANDEHERVAYMFQLWAAGKLNLGPQTQSVFKKVVNFLRKTFGFLTADQKAEVVMQYFHDGKMSEPNLVAEVLSKDPRFQTEFQNKVLDAANPIMRAIREVTFTAQNVLIESGNKGFEKIGRLFSTETGRRNEDISFFDAKMQKTNQYNDHLFNLIRGADEKDLAAAVEGLQTGVVSKDAKIAKLQGSIHKMLEHIYQYMTDAGVKIRHQKDYFPRSWDFTKIAENRAKFEQMLIDEHLKTTGKPLSAGVATGIVNTIIENRGADPLNEDELFAGYTPFMAAANKRVLSFIKSPEFAEYQHNDLREIMTTYIAQAVHKAEYTRRFGHNGSELRKMIIEAVGEEVGVAEWGKARKAAQDKLDAERKKLEALYPKDKGKVLEELTKLGYHKGELQISQIAAEITDKEARTKFADYEPQLRQNVRAIMAMEGTLGADINPNLRKWQAALIVYENMRLLGMSLFSQVIDPLGVLVRGGSLNDAWNTFKKGLAGTWAGWRGHPLEDSASKLAMRLGIIDAGAYMNSQGNAYSSIFLGKTAKKWNDRLFRWNGVEGFSQGTRVGAMEAAIAFIKAHSTLPTEHSERWLSELNLKASDIKLDAKGELDYSDPKIQQAIFRWVEGAILRPNAAMRPSWSSDPHFALIFHLKQFTYAMQKVLLERVANEAKHGNYDPAITMILTYVPAMMAADFLRGIAAHGGEEPPWKRRWTFGDYLADGVQRAGLFGVPQLALDTAKWGPTELAGPAVEQVNRIGKTFLRDIERDIELDVKAAASGNIGDLERARDFNGVAHAAKKSLRDALPINSLTKRYVYDEVVGK